MPLLTGLLSEFGGVLFLANYILFLFLFSTCALKNLICLVQQYIYSPGVEGTTLRLRGPVHSVVIRNADADALIDDAIGFAGALPPHTIANGLRLF